MAVLDQRYEAPLEQDDQRGAGLPVVCTLLLLFLSPLLVDLLMRLRSLIH